MPGTSILLEGLLMKTKAFGLALLLSTLPAVAANNATVDKSINQCNQSIKEGNASKALDYANAALQLDKSSHDALLCKGRAYDALQQYPQAIEALQASEKAATDANQRMLSLLILGNVQREAGQRAQALETYEKGLTVARAEKSSSFERASQNMIGDTQLEGGQPDEALKSYQQGSQLAANDNERGESYARIASAHDKLGNPAGAIEYQIKAMLMQEQAGERDEYANAGLDLSHYYLKAKDYTGAENTINKVLKFAKDNGSPYWEARSSYVLGQVKAAQGDVEGARTLMLAAHHTARQIGATSLANEIGNAMLDLEKK
ncbi:MAG TPA: tetratricopeptide repeat protein [Methylophilaceae bacterium]|nr:tetratricopeptide repeat protein [Methylophilaceae bacterium]